MTPQNSIVLIFTILCLCPQGHATIYNPQLNPVGEEEPFMANTGVAAEGSAGATFFNPAALAFLHENKLSATGSYMGTNNQTGNSSQVGGINLSTESNGSTMSPTLVAVLLPHNDWTFGFSILQTEDRELDSHNYESLNINILGQNQTSELWAGFSISKKANERWSLGLSTFAIRNTELQNDTVDVNTNTVTVMNRTSSSFYGMAFIGGVQFKPDPSWILGLRIRSPFIQFFGSSDYFVYPNSADQVASQDSIATNYYFPFDFSIGGNYLLSKNVRVLCDIGYQLATSYEVSIDPNLGKPVGTSSTPRINFGSQVKLGPSHKLLLGALYNPSTQQNESTSPNGTVSENFYGGSLGVEFIGKFVSATVGAFYYWSFGSIVETIPGTTNSGVFGSVQDRNFGGLFSVASNM